MKITTFLRKFLDESPLFPCKEELTCAKKQFFSNDLDTMKLKQKRGIVIIESKLGDYSFKFKITVPDDYPNVAVEIKCENTNFPISIAYYITCQAREIARKHVEAPLNKTKQNINVKFAPKPHLYEVISFLVKDCGKTYPSAICHICKERCFPRNSKDVVKDEKHEKYVERLYCLHLYHHGCLSVYMKKPPFKDGKPCLACGVRVRHDKFNISPRVAEQRWAQKEARKRELDEVVDFLS